MNSNVWKSFVEELDWTINLKHSTTYSRQMKDFSEEILLGVKKAVGEICDASAACLAPEKEEACVIVKFNLGLLRDMGFRNKWKVNVCLIDWFLLASLNQLLLVHIEYWLLEGYRVYGICSGPTPMIFVRYTMNRQSGLWIIRLWSLLKAFFQVRKLVQQCFEMNIAF